jgi:hypothetical protein
MSIKKTGRRGDLCFAVAANELAWRANLTGLFGGHAGAARAARLQQREAVRMSEA